MPPTLYLLALMPPPELSARIRTIQEDFAAAYHCRAGLKNRVHITLLPPFRVGAEEAALLSGSLAEWAAQQAAFPVALRQFRSFRRNGVIFIDVVVDDALESFQHRLEMHVRNLLPEVSLSSHQPYHPHVTIGYRDIPPHRFREAEAAYLALPFEASFPADRFYLWRHNGAKWEIGATWLLPG